MTTMEGALALFFIMLTVGLTLAGLIVPQVRRINSRCRVNQQFRQVRADIDRARDELIEAKARQFQQQMNTPHATEAHDYCAGCGNVVLRKAMRWTPEGTWRCRTCAPVYATLAEQIKAAGEALDDPDSAARNIPIIASVPQGYVDHNAKPLAYGGTADGQWSLWANERQARLYASQQEGKHCVVRPEGSQWRVDVHPLDWRPEHDGQVGWMQYRGEHHG